MRKVFNPHFLKYRLSIPDLKMINLKHSKIQNFVSNNIIPQAENSTPNFM